MVLWSHKLWGVGAAVEKSKRRKREEFFTQRERTSSKFFVLYVGGGGGEEDEGVLRGVTGSGWERTWEAFFFCRRHAPSKDTQA